MASKRKWNFSCLKTKYWVFIPTWIMVVSTLNAQYTVILTKCTYILTLTAWRTEKGCSCFPFCVEFPPRFVGNLPHKFAVIEFGLLTLLHFPTSSNIMPLNATQLTAFWRDNDQMGLSARTCTKMETEGLTLPEDFADFPRRRTSMLFTARCWSLRKHQLVPLWMLGYERSLNIRSPLDCRYVYTLHGRWWRTKQW